MDASARHHASRSPPDRLSVNSSLSRRHSNSKASTVEATSPTPCAADRLSSPDRPPRPSTAIAGAVLPEELVRSEGWLTESALLPEPARPIAGVPATAAFQLKSVVDRLVPTGPTPGRTPLESRQARRAELTKRHRRTFPSLEESRLVRQEAAEEELAECRRLRTLERKAALYAQLSSGGASPADSTRWKLHETPLLQVEGTSTRFSEQPAPAPSITDPRVLRVDHSSASPSRIPTSQPNPTTQSRIALLRAIRHARSAAAELPPST